MDDLQNRNIVCTDCGKSIDPRETYEQYAGRTVCKNCRMVAQRGKVRSFSGVRDRGAKYLLQKTRGIHNAAVGIRSCLETHGLAGLDEEIRQFINELIETGNYIHQLAQELIDDYNEE